MWVLETSTLHYFISPEKVPGGYVILSHVWDQEELSFQQFQEINNRRYTSDKARRRLISPKVTQMCNIASRHEYKWAWIDTCCIDKTSSAELSEAINSMFHYYSIAHICYVYLSDVPEAHAFHSGAKRRSLRRSPPKFHQSRWHKRGWTLQELVAPHTVYFFSDRWEYLGSKAELADRLEKITRIPASVLRLESKPRDFSVAQRMSWAAGRKTTRVEDEAYSLLGIFGVNMPTLYGEGRRAFRRLQEEIMKQSPDTTLFAWGFPQSWADVVRSSHSNGDRPSDEPDSTGKMFAEKPEDFICASDIRYTPGPRAPEHHPKAQELGGPGDTLITFRTTPYGLLARLPVYEIEGRHLADLFWTKSDGSMLFLNLGDSDDSMFTSTYPRYIVGVQRLVRLPIETASKDDIRADSASIVPSMPHVTWQDVYIMDLIQEPYDDFHIPVHIPMTHTPLTPVRIPEHLITSLVAQLQACEVKVINATMPWVGDPPLTIGLRVRAFDYFSLRLQVGRCTKLEPGHPLDGTLASGADGRIPGCLWASVTMAHDMHLLEHDHQCPDDHILTWPRKEKSFTLAPWSQEVTLAFTQRRQEPALVLTKFECHDRDTFTFYKHRSRLTSGINSLVRFFRKTK